MLYGGTSYHLDNLMSIANSRFPGKDVQTAVRELMELPPTKELDLPPTAGGPAKQLLKKLGLD